MSDKLQLIKVKNPFNKSNRDIATVDYIEGQSLLDIRNVHFPQDVPVVSSLNGRVIDIVDLASTKPQHGDCIVFVPEIQGGGDGGGKQILGIIAMIALAIALPSISVAAGQLLSDIGLTSLAGSSFFMTTVVPGIIMMAGGMLVNSLMPKPKLPSLNTDISDFDRSQTYSWNPQTTQQQGTVIPKFYGTNKLYGNIIASYIENVNDKQYLNALICFGMGPYKRLYDFKINDQPVENLQGVEIQTRYGNLGQTPIPNFNDTKTEYPLSVKITNGSPYTYVTQGSDFNGLEVDVLFPQGLYYANDNGGLDSYSVNLKIEVRKQGETNWRPITSQVITTQQTIYNSKWSAGRWEYGSDDNYYWHEYQAGDSNQYSHYEGEEVYIGDPYYPYVQWHWIDTSYIQTVSQTVDHVTVSGAQTSSIRRTFKADNLSAGKYEIRVSNLTADQTSSRYGDDCYLNSCREVLYDDFEYPRHVLVGIKALATDQLSGSLRFSCMAECIKVRIYDGTNWTVDYSDNPAWVAWDILTKPIFNNNLNVIRYDGIDPSRLDLVKFKEWADFCNELVPNGKGGQEKRITFNGGFDAETTVWEALLAVCQLGRAVPIPNGRGITLWIDKPTTPTMTFTAGNITLDSFKETFLPLEERATEIEVDFNNSENDYNRDKFSVLNPNITSKINKISMQLIGCTKPSEAWRHASYKLANNQYLLRTSTISASADAIGCVIGDVVNIAHEVPQWGYSGRLVSANSTSVTIDRKVTIESGKSYAAMIVYGNPSMVTYNGTNYICRLAHTANASNQPGIGADWNVYWDIGGDGSSGAWTSGKQYVHGDYAIERTVTSTAGEYEILNVDLSGMDLPRQYDNYSFGELNKLIKPFRVLDIQPTQDLEHTLYLIEYNASVHNVDYGYPALPTYDYSSINVLPSVTDIRLNELLIRGKDGAITDVIDVYFTRPNSSQFAHAEIWYSKGGGWVYSGISQAGYYRIENAEINKTYQIAVITVNTAGQKQSIQNAPKASIYTLGKLDPPSNVTNFTAKQNGQFIDFNWSHIPDADLWGYEIRMGTNWESARTIKDGIQENSASWQAELNGTYRFLIKAMDESELYSNTATSVDITLRGINENLNIILSQDEMTKATPADGTKTNLVYINPYHALMIPHTLTDTDVPTWTDTTTDITNYKGDINLNAEYITNAIDTYKDTDTWIRVQEAIDALDAGATDQSYIGRTDLTYPEDTDLHITMPADFVIYYSVSDDNITYSGWKQYTGTIQENFRYVKIKFILNIVSQTGRCKLLNLLLSFDVPDVNKTIADLSIAATTGTDITFSNYGLNLYTTPVAKPFIKNATGSRAPSISNLTANGCHIDIYDATNAKVAGTIDLEITGY